MQLSIVIPTRNRKERLLRLLRSLASSKELIREIIIADSSDERQDVVEMRAVIDVPLTHHHMEAGVCLQRNAGIRLAGSEWVMLCDDDIEVPAEYLPALAAALQADPSVGAISGLVLQHEAGGWVSSYPVSSRKELLLKYIFGLGIWGEIRCDARRWPFSAISRLYLAKGNHLSTAGWPVLTALEAPYFDAPVYGLGAAVIRRDWLLAAPYDEVLDAHGIGDNFSVVQRLPGRSVRVLTEAFVYHHQEQENRLQQATTYYRRALALDYYRRTLPGLASVRRSRMLWSLFGNFVIYSIQRNAVMRVAAWKTLWRLIFRPNPYVLGVRNGARLVSPALSDN
jgi:glycosyltransferase involved in cell wall biosynthesis